jgi:hypothetical protein
MEIFAIHFESTTGRSERPRAPDNDRERGVSPSHLIMARHNDIDRNERNALHGTP